MIDKLISKHIVVVLFLIIILSGWLYKDSFSAYFFQDDWFSLRISSVKSITGFLQFFIPRTDVIYYRPLGMQIPFFFLRNIFGINPLPFHVLTFLTHATNIFLIFYLFAHLGYRIKSAVLSAVLYSTSSIHYIPFYWSSTYPFVLGPTAFFLSVILFLKFMKVKKARFYYLSVCGYIFGLLIAEIVVIMPIILFFYLLFWEKKSSIRYLLIYIFFGLILFSIRFIYFTPPSSGYYQMGLGRELINNVKAYLLWSFNWPEEMKGQFINFFTINPQFVRDFPWYFSVFTTALFLEILLLFILPLITCRKIENLRKKFIFGIIWFIAGLIPVIVFPKHSFSYYLPISLVGLLLIGTYLFDYFIDKTAKVNKNLAYLFVLMMIFIWYFTSQTTIEFNSKIHWAPRRANLSKELVEKAKKDYNFSEQGNYIYIQPLSENKLALNGQDGLKVVFNNENIVTIYGSDTRVSR